MAEFQIMGPSYVDDTLLASSQDTINWVPEKVEAPGGRTEYLFRTPQGLTSFSSVAQNACRGLHEMNGTLYAVIGTKLYEIPSNGTEVDRGTISGSTVVSMADNGTQLVIVNGTGGYVFNDGTNVLAAIADSDFVAANTVAYIDGYFVFDGDGGQFFISSLGDATTYDALDFATAESAPDDTVGVFVDHQELWVLGEKTIEIWRNTGNPDFPFERSAGLIIERGVGAAHTFRKMDNTVYWLADNGIVYNAAGHTPQRVSTHALEQEIARHTLSSFYAWTYQDKGHWNYVLQCPSNGKTFLYDAATQLWYRRKSLDIDRWRAAFCARAYGKTFVGDYTNGTVWEIKDGVYKEGSDDMISERYTQYISSEQNPVFHHSLELLFDTGFGLSSGDGSDPQVEMRLSNDGGHNYGAFKQRSIGQLGQYGQRVRFHGLGMARVRNYHIRVSDPVKRDLLTAYVRTSEGFGA